LEDEAKPIQLTVTAEDETKFSFQIFSLSEIDDPAWTLHAEGAMVQVDSESWQTSLPVERIEGGQWQNGQTVADRLSGYEEIDVDRFYQTCRERGIDYDRHFRAVQQLWFIPNRPTAEALGRIQLPENVSSAAYTLHPILLDACFQVLGAAFIEPDQETDQTDLYLPVSLDRVQCWRPAGTGLWSHVQVVPRSDPTAQQLKANVNLFDDQGTVATIEGLTVRRVTPAMMLRGQSLKGVTYKITWLETPLPNGGAISSSNKWLIFADRGGTGTALAQRLSDNGDECVLIFAGPVSQQSSDNTYTLNPTRPDAYQPLLARLAAVDPRPYDGVIHLWSLDADQEADETIQKQVELVCSSTLSILQTLVQNGWVTRLWLVTRGAQPVVDDVSHVAQASLWGLGRVIALEHPEFQTICLDLDPSEMPETLPMLARELLNPTAENQVAFRQGDRYIARLVRSHTPATTEPVTLDKDGSYLITGGLGGLGLQIANLLTQNGARHLILAGRSGATGQDQQQAVAKLEQLGCQVLVIRADISRQADVKTLLTQIQAAMPPLKGVIHAAGVLDDGVLQQQNWSRFERVLAPKVQGVWHLHTLTQELPLDFFVCFSSLSSLLGSPGQGNYAAANAFMDALAHQRRARGQSGLAINWGPWAEVGMATAQSSRWAGLGVQALEPEQGAHFLWELLGYDQPQVAVFPVRWSKFREQFGFQVPPLFADLWQTKPIDTAQFEKLKKRLSQRPYEAEEILLAEIQSQLAQVLGLPADEWLDPKQKLFEIGMDSLMALELRNRLQLLVSNTLPATLLFNYPSVEGLVGYLKEEVFAEVIAGAQPPAEEPAVTAPERDELASLSEDDLEAKLLQKIAAVKERKLS
ncbi:MAG TPA: type I polyketide synthase, partial [Anaerolineae bacterium]